LHAYELNINTTKHTQTTDETHTHTHAWNLIILVVLSHRRGRIQGGGRSRRSGDDGKVDACRSVANIGFRVRVRVRFGLTLTPNP